MRKHMPFKRNMCRKLIKFRFIELYFLDSIENSGGWERIKDFDLAGHRNAMLHKMCGYVIGFDYESISLCRVAAIDNEEKMTNVWSVPIGAIKSIRFID